MPSHGELDAIVPVEFARQLAAALRDVEVHLLPDTGHVPTITRPETVADLIHVRFPAG